MLCVKILGNINDERFRGLKADYVDIEWHEAFKKLHRKVTHNGEEIGIRLENDILTTGLREGDVLYADDEKAVVVNIPPCEAIAVDIAPDHVKSKIKAAYEIGNKHASLFYGENENQFLTPYNEPTLELLNKIHGVKAYKTIVKFDFNKAISSSINNHTH